MRVLQVNHQYPPFSSQGSELYCQNLGDYLMTAGDDVGVFHISVVHRAGPRSLRHTTSENGLELFHCIDGREYSRQASWRNAYLENAFVKVLRLFRPDVVHFHNYLNLASELPGLARAQGARVVYTLHDFGLICPNNLLLRTDGSICGKADPTFFQSCCPQRLRVAPPSQVWLANRLPSLERWRSYADHYPHRRRRMLLQGAVTVAERSLGHPLSTNTTAKREFFFERTRRIFAHTHLFIAPSASLRERFIACGLPSERVVHIRYGMAHFQPVPLRPSPDGRLRFGYIGAFHAHKGIAVLMEAFAGLDDRATLHLHGSSFGSPVSEAHFRRFTADPGLGVVVHGRYDNARIGELLADLDAVIVPSVWLENSPLTIQEAQIAGVPVITSDVGGMAELVRDGVDGLLFRVGDAADLRRVLLQVIEHPELLQQLRAQAPGVPTIETQAQVVRDRYVQILQTARHD